MESDPVQSDFTRRAYGTNYVETLRVQIHANCRIRRIYFSDRLYSKEVRWEKWEVGNNRQDRCSSLAYGYQELPSEFKLFRSRHRRYMDKTDDLEESWGGVEVWVVYQ